MRRLTFAGFLAPYVRALAGLDSLSLPKLAERAAEELRLREPLLLWAAVTGRGERLAPFLADEALRDELSLLMQLHTKAALEPALDCEDARLRPEYTKAWRSYTVRRDAKSRDASLKLTLRDRVLALEAQKHVTRYRMAKDLGLNPGNLHAFLTQGNATKLSLDRAAALVSYLQSA